MDDFHCVEYQFLLAFTIHFGWLKAIIISNSLPTHESFSKWQRFPLTKKAYYFSMPIEIVILAT